MATVTRLARNHVGSNVEEYGTFLSDGTEVTIVTSLSHVDEFSCFINGDGASGEGSVTFYLNTTTTSEDNSAPGTVYMENVANAKTYIFRAVGW